MMQYFHRFSSIRQLFRCFSTSIVDITPLTTEKQLLEINKLMKNYNSSHVPIRTYALFEWMINIINIKPDFLCYLNIIRACIDIHNLTACEKVHHFIETDENLPSNDFRQLQIKLIFMYAKIQQMEVAEKLFHRVKQQPDASSNVVLYGTMFKAYNMNGQPEKTIELFENEVMKNSTSFELDAIAATCILDACGDCHRLDIGEYVHNEVRRLQLLHTPNIRLATAIMDMYCSCNSIDHARDLFDQLNPSLDHIAYSTLMKAYLRKNEPIQVLELFEQFQQSSLPSDSFFYSNIIQAGSQLGLPHQAKLIHRSIPSNFIEKSHSLQSHLISMHAYCFHLNESRRLFNLLRQKDSYSLASLIHSHAIQGKGQQALDIYDENQGLVKMNEQVYQMILYACAFTEGLLREAQEIYKTIPGEYRTTEVAAAMVLVLARASRFDEALAFIRQYQLTSKDVLPLWSALFMICYHSKNLSYAKLISYQVKDNPLISLLYSDMTNSLPSKEVLDYFRKEKLGKCWTEIKHNEKDDYEIHEFRDDSPANSELNVIIKELKVVGVNWEKQENDLKELYCGHQALRLALAENFVHNLPQTDINITKTKPICSLCHEGIKQLTAIRQRNIRIRDTIRVHDFHHGQCSCDDQF